MILVREITFIHELVSANLLVTVHTLNAVIVGFSTQVFVATQRVAHAAVSSRLLDLLRQRVQREQLTHVSVDGEIAIDLHWC